MSLEVHVRCEHPGCDESERAAVAEQDDLGTIVDGSPHDDSFHFVLDSGWIDGPKDWTLGSDGQILCPKHRPAKPDKGGRVAPDQ